jgi:hypothetical protein
MFLLGINVPALKMALEGIILREKRKELAT